ncbi:type II secretion system secretin GspD [Oleiagrimonas sp. C23AA]|uniref:type II secretion system secretin GspD n=1 Tax=Oleiagrimonas sp. C23AA TaxID=2719047 RepID=UPI001421D60D|nr:type II secretion system secretin GspD [Oleiagrimonas sp. C23AA]NII11280.1 type II secretion system secretin GspD [Oleiagrimonas sp. C23AA]
MRHLSSILLSAAVVVLAGCSTLPQPRDDGELQREAVAGTHSPPPPPMKLRQPAATTPGQGGRSGEVQRGSGVFVHGQPAARQAAQGKGAVVFNFEDQPVQAVVKAILGDFLHESYAISPDVKGTVTFSTAQPVTRQQALPILETLLSWTDNALVNKGGRYVVLPSKNAVAGNLVPSLGAQPPQAGLQARLFTLHYIGAKQMQKLLKPFARDASFLLVDPGSNTLVMSGTPQELANYQRTIRTFDVDWLKGMSVGVYNLQRAHVDELLPQLEKLFGPKADTPMAGMLRFLPIERTNAIVVISPQPDYLDEVHQWIERIDRGGGNQPQLYVYDVKNVQASDLSDYLNQIYNGTKPQSDQGQDQGGQVGPGLTSHSIGSEDSNGDSTSKSSSGLGSDTNGSSDRVQLPRRHDSQSRRSDAQGSGSQTGIRITAVDSNNQLLVRCRPSQWADIQSAIKRLDTVPLQVQIETRILEVKLTGEFSFGVQWYLEGLIGGTDSGNTRSWGQPGNEQAGALGGGGTAFNSTNSAFYYSFINSNLQAAVRAIETSANTKILSAPSLVVMNNQEAKIQVGTQVPVNQTYITSGISTGSTGGIQNLGSVDYKDTGVILDVRPRVNPGGLVYLTLDQVVSKPGVKDQFGNFPIDKRELATQIAVQSGQTVLLGGLIQQDEGTTDTGIPGLNHIPVLGRLFGTTSRHRNRTELLVLITPRVISDSDDARTITDEYQRKFESLAPLRGQQHAHKTDNRQ